MNVRKHATAFAPATVANVAVGFDILGFALENLGEKAKVTRLEGTTDVLIDPVEGFPEISIDPEKNTATAGLVRLIREKKLNFGFHVSLQKNIPVGSGLGGSSMSAVAGLIAANALLTKKLTPDELLDYALTGEAVASGARHADNVGPCLTGGMVFSRSSPFLEVTKIKTPRQLMCVILLPALSIKTSEARSLLSQQVPLKSMIEQTANLTGFLLGCVNGDFAMIRSSLKDVVIEPQRARLIPGFYDLQAVAMKAGALGFSISGSGPAMFALAQGPAQAKKLHMRLLEQCRISGLQLAGHWALKLSTRGARLVSR